MHCAHQILLGSSCLQCPGGVAVLPKRKRSISPVRPQVSPPSPIAMLPIGTPTAVGSLHTALAASAAASSGSGSRGSSSDGVHADPLHSTSAVNLLNAIVQALPAPDPSITLTTNACSLGAVCWNWAFAGGLNAAAQDPQWAFLYVTVEHPAPIPFASVEVKAKLDAARLKLHARGQLTKALATAVYTDILHGLIIFYGFREQENSDLKLVFYHDPTKVKTALMYRHVEFEYQTITITKGLDEKLKAFHGISRMNGFPKPAKIVIAIDPNSLSQAHIDILRSLIADLAPAEHLSKKRKPNEG